MVTLPKSVTSTKIVSLLCFHVAKLGFQRLGFYPHKIGSHLLCSGGAMTFRHAHIPDIHRWELPGNYPVFPW